MADVRDAPKRGLRVASTFAGCGGSSTGYRLAGYDVVYANEFVDLAADSYAANCAPTTVLDRSDIRSLPDDAILTATGLAAGELDVLDGSPPCASFSTVGKRSAGWGTVNAYSGTKQRTDDLFYEFIRILAATRPKVFVAENVSGLVKGVSKGYFKAILAAMISTGYRVSARLLDASYLGVPQARQRLIFVGVRDDLDIEPSHPGRHGHRWSVTDALSAVGEPAGITVDPETGQSLALYGNMLSEWRKGVGAPSRYINFARPRPTYPCPTILAVGGSSMGTACVVHPTEPRKFTIAELRAISSFPRDFALTGSYGNRWERIGRSVPPVMMQAVAEHVAEQILGRVHV